MIKCVYTAAGCSPENDTFDINEQEGMLVFGAGSNIISMCLDDPNRPKRQLFIGPCDQIHSVKIARKSRIILAGSASGKLFAQMGNMERHVYVNDSSINSLDVLDLPNGNVLVVFSDIQGFLHQLTLSKEGFVKNASLSFGLKKVISISSVLIHDIPIIFIGTSDNMLDVIIDMKVVLSLPGHTNWINTIDNMPLDDESVLVATGSSDRTIRIWKVALVGRGSFELAELVPSKREFILDQKHIYTVDCISILYGHESMVNSVRWHSTSQTLITAATDHTIIRWKSTGEFSGWNSAMQIGDISSLGTVGGDRSAGFFTAKLVKSPVDGVERIYANVSTGSILQFELLPDGGFSSSCLCSGHTLETQSCSWEPSDGAFLATTSLDKTTRLWHSNGNHWYEVSRPQIHGYEMKAIAILDREHLISAGDEKIIRAFEAPPSFAERLSSSEPLIQSPMTTSVFLPALGLSNKLGNESATFEAPLNQPPTEYDLGRLTLWLETDKLYGHGLELQCLAVTSCGQLVASASKATTIEDAIIRFWRRNVDNTWTPLETIVTAHTLTIVKLIFSPDDRFLLAVSRDRQFSITAIDKENGFFKLRFIQKEAHRRIIWSGDWSHDGSFFVTASRDKTVKTWKIDAGGLAKEDESLRLSFAEAATSVAIHRSPLLNNLMAIGLEDGSLHFYCNNKTEWEPLALLEAHKGGATSSVTDLKWHPSKSLLACCASVLQLYHYTT